ncbi:zinc ribbon domain-containing protein [Bacillus bingmayongensis]|uniref:zinc ribbon domain-containing protein n=1 Tax=Bacillus bingmayongensis TaxID=1150157 RepID=UPI001C8F0FE0|nr:zinc ribbon domain-containing protein [Bacillus bingmayongensis]MBY0596685.1 zinc ribbon domain-containing protein [Bacillus bingmayongensis]
MYCRMCGNQHGEEVNYCPNEGSMAIVATDSVILEQDNSKYCRGCGGENAQQNLYCQKCGHSLFTVKKKEQIVKLPSMEKGPKVELGLHKNGLRTGVIGGAIASVLMLLAGWIGSLVFAAMTEEFLHKFARELDMLSGFYNGATATLLNYHLLGVSAEDADGMILSLYWHTPFLLLLLIPFIILGGTGIWIGKQRVANTIGEQVTMAATVGIIYGLFLFIISFIASKSISIPGMDTVTVLVGFSSFKSLVSGFICGTIFSLLGMIAHTSQNNMAEAFRELLPYGASLYYGAVAMVKGFLLTAVILCVTALFMKEDSVKPMKEFTSTTSQRIMLTLQVTPQVWNMAHLAPVEVKSPVFEKGFSGKGNKGKDNEMQFSFVSGMSFNGTGLKDLAIAEGAGPEDLAEIEDVNSTFHYGLLLLIIPFFFMFRVGQKLARIQTANIYVTLAVCSGAYTFMMLLVNILSKFQIDISGTLTSMFGMSGTMLSMQGSWMYLILGSFILTYVAAFAGMKLARK